MKAVINQQSGTNSFFLKINKTNNKANLKGTKAFSSIIQSNIIMNNNGMKTLTEKPIELSVNELKDFLKNNKAEVFVKHDNQLINVTKLFLGNDSTPTKTIIENPLAKGKDGFILDKSTDLLIAKPLQERKITEVKVDKEESKSKKVADNSLLIQLVINDINVNFLDKKDTPKIETNSNNETPLKHKTTALQYNTQKADIKNIIQEKPQRKISENILQVPARKKAELVFASFTENKLTFDKIESKASAEKPQMQFKLKDTGKPIELNNIRVESNKAPESSDSIVNPIQRKTVSFDKTNESINYKTVESTNHKTAALFAKNSTDIEAPKNIKFISNEAIKSVKIVAIEMPQTQSGIANVDNPIRNQSKVKSKSFKGQIKPEKSEQLLSARQVGEERPINEGHKRTQRVEQFVDKKQDSATISRTKTMPLQTVNLKSTNRIENSDNQSISEFKITENALPAKNSVLEEMRAVPNAKISFEQKAENRSSFLPKHSSEIGNKETSFAKEVNLKNDKLDNVKPFMTQISQKTEMKDTPKQNLQEVAKALPKEEDKSIKVEKPILPKEQVVNNASSVKHTFTGLNSTTIGKAAAMQNVENKRVYLAKPADRTINTERPLGVQNEPDIAGKVAFKQNTNDAVKSLPKREIKITRQSIPNLKIIKTADNKISAEKISHFNVKKGSVHKASLDLKPQEVISTQSSKQEEIIKPEKIALKDIKQQNNKASFKKTSTFSQKQDIEIKTSIEQKQQGVVSHFSKQTETIKQTVQKEPMSIGLNTSKAKPEFVSITQKVEDINKPEKIVSNKMSTESFTHIKQEPEVKFYSKQNSVEASKPLSKQTEEIVKPEKIVSNKVPTESFTHTNIKQEPDVKFFSKQNSVEVSKPLSKQTEEIVKPEKIVSNKPTTESSIHRNIKQEPEVKDTLVQKQNDSAKQSQVQPKIDEKLGNDAYLSESFKANKVTDMANNNGTVTNKKVDRSIKAVQINTDSLQRKNDMSGIKPMPSIIAKEQYTVLQNTVSPVFTEKREDQRVVIQPVNNIKKSKNISFNTKPKEAEQVKTAESVKPNQLNESKSMDKKVAFTANEINKNQSDYSIKNKENFIPNSIKMEKNIQSQTTENIEPIQQPKHDVQRERSMTNDMAQQMHNKPYEARISSFERMKGMEDMHSFEDGVNVQKGINADIVQDYIDKNEPFIIHYFDNDGQERQKTVFVKSSSEKVNTQSSNSNEQGKAKVTTLDKKQNSQSDMQQENKSNSFHNSWQTHAKPQNSINQSFTMPGSRYSIVEFLPKIEEAALQLRQNSKAQKATLELETEELGYVKTSVEKQGDRIIVKFELENLQRLDSLKENLNNLEQQLKGHGFEEVVMEFNFHKESHQQDSQKAFHHAGNKVFKIDDSNNLPQMEEVSVTRDYGYNSMEYTI